MVDARGGGRSDVCARAVDAASMQMQERTFAVGTDSRGRMRAPSWSNALLSSGPVYETPRLPRVQALSRSS